MKGERQEKSSVVQYVGVRRICFLAFVYLFLSILKVKKNEMIYLELEKKQEKGTNSFTHAPYFFQLYIYLLRSVDYFYYFFPLRVLLFLAR